MSQKEVLMLSLVINSLPYAVIVSYFLMIAKAVFSDRHKLVSTA